MNVIQTFTQTFTDIANAIRDKLCLSSSEYTFKPSEMYSYISWIHTTEDLSKLLEGTTSVFRDFTLSSLNPSNGNWATFQRLARTLEIVDCPNVTYVGFSQLFLSCSKLQVVNLPNITSWGPIYSTFNNCSQLSYLNLNNIPLFTSVVPSSYFSNFTKLQTFNINLDNVTSIGSAAFYNCNSLSSISIPNVTTIGNSAFGNCSALASISLPNVTTIGHSAFRSCTNLSSIDLPNVTTIGAFVFANCIKLMSIYLLGSSVCYMSGRTNTYQTASASNVFSNTPILDSTLTGSFGSIYVPSSLVSEYRNNWNLAFTVRFVGV